MYSVIKSINVASVPAEDAKNYVEAACLSTDSKPTDGIANGSICLEMNTGKVYAYNEAGEAWVEL